MSDDKVINNTTPNKKRGRPPNKKNKAEINENQGKIIMSKDNQNQSSNTQITIDQVNSRLKNIFNRATSNGTSYTDFKNALSQHLDNSYLNPMYNNNPFIQNQRIKTSSSSVGKIDKKEILLALSDPENNEQLFREQSMALYYNNYTYNNLLKLNREIPEFYYYITPIDVEKKDLKSDKFLKEKRFLNKYIEKFNIPLTFKDLSMQIAQEGKCSYIYRTSFDKTSQNVNYAVLQKLPSDYIKYVGYGSDSPLVVSFNFMMFLNPMYDINQWSTWMQTIWGQLKESGIIEYGKKGIHINPSKSFNPNHIIENNNGSYAYWVTLPQDMVYTFGTDFSNPLQLPEYIGLFLDLKELESYKWLQTQTMLTNITNILTATVPMEKEAKAGSDAAILSNDVILGLQGDCSSSLNSNIFPFFAPLEDFKLHKLEHIPNANDIYLSTLRDVLATAGTSGLLNTTDKPSIAMIKGSQSLQESKNKYLTYQYQKFINTMIEKYLGLQYEYKCTIWGGIFSSKDEIKTLKEMIQNGNIGFLPRLLSAYNMTIEDYKINYDYVDVLKLFPIEDNNTNTSGTKSIATHNIGRNKIEEEDILNDNTAASQEGGQNVSENK